MGWWSGLCKGLYRRAVAPSGGFYAARRLCRTNNDGGSREWWGGCRKLPPCRTLAFRLRQRRCRGSFFRAARLAVSRRKIEPRRAGNNDPLSPDNSDGYRFSSPFRGCAAQTIPSCGRLLPMVAVSCRLVERRKRFAIGNGSGRVESCRAQAKRR